MLPANEARQDLANTRASVGMLGGLKRLAPRPPQPPTPVSTMPGMRLTVPLGKPADANPWMVGPGSSPANPPAPPTTPTPVPVAPPPAVQQATATPGAATTNFGPGNDLVGTQITPSSQVNRTQLAQNTLKDWDAQNAPQLAAGFRAVGQNAAKFGRIGAGMTTNDLTGLQATYDRNRMEMANNLASGLASDTVNDERANRAELRGERGYQNDLSQQAIDNNVRQKTLEDALLNSSFGRAQARTATGYADNPGGALLGAGSDLTGDAGNSIASGTALLSRRQQPQPAGVDYQALLEQLIKQQMGG